MSTASYEQLVREGILAAKAGRRSFAQYLLNRAANLNPSDARPWLWLSATTDNPEEQRRYLERAVAADPFNPVARRGLAVLSGELDPDELLREGAGVVEETPDEPVDATAQTFACPECGGGSKFEPHQEILVCEYCGHELPLDEVDERDADGQLADLVLPTRQGHVAAVSEVRLACQNCGAVTFLAAAQTTHQCAYCGSDQLVESPATEELLAPQGIGLMVLKAPQVTRMVREWMQAGLYTPEDLPSSADHLDLRPAYYPFWIFEGALEARWTCQVSEGAGEERRWVPREGTEVEMFSNVLIPGMSAISLPTLAALEPFDLEQIVPFMDDQLAGWTALTYDRPLSDASLLAREQVVKDFRQALPRRVNLAGEARDLQLAGTQWSGLVYKLVLLPLWSGSYRYQGRPYRLLVNGQTGKVTGQKPRDQATAGLVWLTVGLGVIVALLVLTALWLTLGDSIQAALESLLGPG